VTFTEQTGDIKDLPHSKGERLWDRGEKKEKRSYSHIKGKKWRRQKKKQRIGER